MKKRTHIDMSVGDAIDRLSILTRKIAFGEEGAYKEHTHLSDSIKKLKLPLSGALLAAIMRITYANFEVWNLENEFRRGVDLPAERVKQMMIDVRDFNKKRIEAKNEINRITEMGFREFKTHHRSQ